MSERLFRYTFGAQLKLLILALGLGQRRTLQKQTHWERAEIETGNSRRTPGDLGCINTTFLDGLRGTIQQSSSVNATLVGAHMCTPENPRPELRLLREIYRSSLGLPFSAAGIIDRAQINLEQNEDSSLHVVIFETIGELSSRKLGNLLADIAGEAIGDYVVNRFGRKRKPRVGQLWRIEKKR